MTRIIYVNGRYQPYHRAEIHAEDRGFQFGDAVYEVFEVRAGRLIDEGRHMARLDRSLAAIAIENPLSAGAWRRVLRETVRRNRVRDGLVYLQVSRGSGPRNFLFGGVRTPPTVVCLARAVDPVKQVRAAHQGIGVITLPEMRWARCDIKTVMLLPASLAKEQAARNGAQEAWFVDREGCVLEGGSSNAWIITHTGEVVTRPLDNQILSGVTRLTLIEVLARQHLQLSERAFTTSEALAAKEAFITSASNLVMPVVSIDGQAIADGQPGAVTKLLRARFHEVAETAGA